MAITFNAIIKIQGINPYVLVSAARANAVKPGWRKPLPVLVRVNGKPADAWRINMMPVGNGSFYLYLHGDVRKASGTAVGDRVRVEVAFDASYRSGPQQPMPKWFQQALAANPQAKKNWMALIPSRKKRSSAISQISARLRPKPAILPELSTRFPALPAGSWGAHGAKDHEPVGIKFEVEGGIRSLSPSTDDRGSHSRINRFLICSAQA